MMRFISQEWNLGTTGHKNFNFVDVNINGDNLLFIDPSRIEQSQHPIAKQCVVMMQSFFDVFFAAYRDKNRELKNEILSHATEENSTHLGYGHPGKGNTSYGLLEKFSPLNNLIETIPTIRIAQDLPVLIEGFAEDGMSDMLTNMLHYQLHQYTLQQMEIFDIKANGTKSFYSWNPATLSWELYTKQPCYKQNNRPIMLVPKDFVRRSYLFSTSQYLERIIIERVRTDGGGIDPQGKLIPKRYYLEHHIPHRTKNWRYETAIEYSKEYPDALSEYHDKLPGFYNENGRAMTDDELNHVIYELFSTEP